MMGKEKYSTSFLEFLEPNKNKAIAVISKCQYAINIDSGTHEGMLADLISNIRPRFSKNNFSIGDCIIILADNGYPGIIYIELPKSQTISLEQYNCLSEILYYIKNYNRICAWERPGYEYEINVKNGNNDIDIKKNYANDIDGLLKILNNYVINDNTFYKERIIGRKFDNKEEYVDKIIESMDSDTNNLKYKGYSSLPILILFSTFTSISVLILAIFLIID